MKYLAYFQPNKDLSNLILKQKNIFIPSSGLHSTLCFFYMEPKHENKLVADLNQIIFNSFEIKTLNFDDFDNNSLVLKLSLSNELFKLHKKIVAVVKNYANVNFDGIAKKYFEENYKPHFTISKSPLKFDKIQKELISLVSQRDEIKRYSLTKKLDGNWKKIQNFYSTGDDSISTQLLSH